MSEQTFKRQPSTESKRGSVLGSEDSDRGTFDHHSFSLSSDEKKMESIIDKSYLLLSPRNHWIHKVSCVNLVGMYMLISLSLLFAKDPDCNDRLVYTALSTMTVNKAVELMILIVWTMVLLTGDLMSVVKLSIAAPSASIVLKMISLGALVLSGATYTLGTPHFTSKLERSAAVLVMSKMDSAVYYGFSNLCVTEHKLALQDAVSRAGGIDLAGRLIDAEKSTQTLYRVSTLFIAFVLILATVSVNTFDRKTESYYNECS